MIMKLWFKILFFVIVATVISANETKSITIKHIGDQDLIWEVVIINVRRQGYLLEISGFDFFYYYAVHETTFDEIIDLIHIDNEIFYDNKWGHEFGSFELYVENEGEEYYCYLNDRISSALFFNKLHELIKSKGNYNELLAEIESLFRFFRLVLNEDR